MLTIELQNEANLEARLAALAKMRQCSPEHLLQTLVENVIEDMELYYRGVESYESWCAEGKPQVSLKDARSVRA